MTLRDIVSALHPDILGEKYREFNGIGTDTRADLRGKLFIALKGPTYDAHNFLAEAVKAGATGLLVHDRAKGDRFSKDVTVFSVGNTLKALQDLGHYWRRQQKAKILSVTGSNGKTTTKEFAAAVIGAHKNTYFNKGSFNNHWGVPLSLLNIKTEHEVAVIEMGMNHLGEITTLCEIAEPDVVLVTNVGRVHLEGLGSIENVAKAKEEIYQINNKNVLRIFNLDNPFTEKMYQKYKNTKCITFSGKNRDAHIFLEVAGESVDSIEVKGSIGGVLGNAKVEIFGSHNVYNLMGAAALALSLRIEPLKIWGSLNLCKTPWGRNQKVKLKSGAELLFDGYNANPESMAAMIENSKFVKVSGKRIAIIGEMRETGEARDTLHTEIGEKAACGNFDLIWFVGLPSEAFERGLKSKGFKKEFLVSPQFDVEVAEKIKNQLQPTDHIWVKGSRGVALERAVVALDPISFSAKY
ncbi:MAG: hypothetical protein A4S09_11490 [Proteobacteria bacterium SG_bin7]|nr:MAG: hypothetical protein A4S09_11490 [Proteobacteria bacterium SG_bin7]